MGESDKYSNNAVLETALSAMMSAGLRYEKWTKGNYAPWQAPEYVYTTSIAQSVARLPFKLGIYCEYNSKDAISEANKATFGRKLKEIRPGSRSDILVTNASDEFRYVVEVKKRVRTKRDIKKDIGRIADIIGPRKTRLKKQKASTITSGASVFFVCYPEKNGKDPHQMLVDFLKSNNRNLSDLSRYEKNAWLIKGAKTFLRDRHFSVKLHQGPLVRKYVAIGDEEETVWAWTSCALEIKPSL